MTAEDLELRALVGLAWEVRDKQERRERVEAITDWHDRRHIRAYQCERRQLAALVQLLRETDPARTRRRAA